MMLTLIPLILDIYFVQLNVLQVYVLLFYWGGFFQKKKITYLISVKGYDKCSLPLKKKYEKFNMQTGI